jgi:3-deoxy-manno-octulosonate cytidylyltransferase (CMP-KDO synthetase)
MSDVAIFIPSRMGATRLPNKPLADINGKPMVIHVAEKARDSKVGDVYVACPDQEIVDVCITHGFKAILTEMNINTGTDRIYQAFKRCGKDYKYVVNLQGDIPLISPDYIAEAVDILKNSDADISTLVSVIVEESEKTNENIVKAVLGVNGKALYFTRASNVPYGDGDLYHHIGIYVYRKEALERFVNLPQTPLEKRERLEQLRALENGMSIAASVVDEVVLGVDTPQDLEKIRKIANG